MHEVWHQCILHYVVLMHAHGDMVNVSVTKFRRLNMSINQSRRPIALRFMSLARTLEARIGKLQFLAVLVFAAYASGLTMIVTNHPVGAEALLPVGASGRVTDIMFIMLHVLHVPSSS